MVKLVLQEVPPIHSAALGLLSGAVGATAFWVANLELITNTPPIIAIAPMTSPIKAKLFFVFVVMFRIAELLR